MRRCADLSQHLNLPPTARAAAFRIYTVFDDFDENEGAWVTDDDEWSWVAAPKGGLKKPMPVAGAWRPGLVAGLIDKIYLTRVLEREGEEHRLLLVKWKGLAHIHTQWVPQAELDVEPANKQRVQRWLKIQAAEAAGAGVTATWELESEGTGADGESRAAGATAEEPYNPEFDEVERVIAFEAQTADDLPPRYLAQAGSKLPGSLLEVSWELAC